MENHGYSTLNDQNPVSVTVKNNNISRNGALRESKGVKDELSLSSRNKRGGGGCGPAPSYSDL